MNKFIMKKTSTSRIKITIMNKMIIDIKKEQDE